MLLHLLVRTVGGPETGPVNVTITSAKSGDDPGDDPIDTIHDRHRRQLARQIELGRPQDLECSIDDVWPLDAASPQVRVTLDHPDYLPRSLIVLLKRGRRGKADILEADVGAALQPAGIIAGTVFDSRRAPAAHAKVAAYIDEGGRTPGKEVGRGMCDEQGRYRLRISAEGLMLIVASHVRHAPGLVEAYAQPGIVADAPPLQLSEGLSIRGTVSTGMGLPLEGWRIEAKPAHMSYTALKEMRHVDAVWYDGRILAFASTCSADGHYEIAGLTPGRYELRAAPEESMPCAREHRDGSPHIFDAPNDAAHIRLNIPAVLVFEVRVAGEQPDFSVPIALLSQPTDAKRKSHRVQTDARGELRLPVMPGTEWRAYIDLPGFSAEDETFTAPEAGRSRPVYLNLLAEGTGGRLLISACNDLGRILPADCRIDRDGAQIPDLLFVALEGRGGPRPRLLPDQPSLTLEDLPAGTYRVTANHPDYLPASHNVAVKDRGVTVVKLTLQRR